MSSFTASQVEDSHKPKEDADGPQECENYFSIIKILTIIFLVTLISISIGSIVDYVMFAFDDFKNNLLYSLIAILCLGALTALSLLQAWTVLIKEDLYLCILFLVQNLLLGTITFILAHYQKKWSTLWELIGTTLNQWIIAGCMAVYVVLLRKKQRDEGVFAHAQKQQQGQLPPDGVTVISSDDSSLTGGTTTTKGPCSESTGIKI